MNSPLTPLPNEFWRLDGRGHGELVPWKAGDTVNETRELTWLHLNYSDQAARAWLPDAGILERPVAESLFDEETRPRVLHHGTGLLLTLRGVNLNPGAEPEDMVSIRLWVDERRIISTRKRRLRSIQEIREALEQGQGPESSGQFLAMLLDKLTRNIGTVVEDLEEGMADVEERILESPGTDARQALVDIRRRTVSLRRYPRAPARRPGAAGLRAGFVDEYGRAVPHPGNGRRAHPAHRGPGRRPGAGRPGPRGVREQLFGAAQPAHVPSCGGDHDLSAAGLFHGPLRHQCGRDTRRS